MSNINENNKKKILCDKYLKGVICNYNDKCVYAHSIEEQYMDDIRTKVFNIIQNEFDLSYLNFSNINDKYMQEILKTLILFTKVCINCINKECYGGVNCKFGIYNKNLQICYDDMMYGSCNNIICKKIHLTKRNFNPINKINKKQDKNYFIPNPIEINSDFFNSGTYNKLLKIDI
jgi:hypothetical protein